MSKYIDLSHNIVDQMIVHPYDDEVKLYQDRFLKKDKYNNFRLETGMHIGTHIDTPMHLSSQKTFINEIPLERFSGNGCLLNVKDESIIGFRDRYYDLVNKNDVVVLYTNHSRKYGTEEYYLNHPLINEELTDFFIEKKIKMLGLDFPSPDKYPFEIHKKLLNNNILIIENMTNLSELLEISKFEIIAFPLKIKADASMTRAIARINLGMEMCI